MKKNSNHRYPLICFDLDGTLVDDTIYIWSTFHEHFKTDRARRTKARDDFFARRITYRQWFESDLQLLDEAGADRSSLVDLISTLPLMPGSLEILRTLKQEGRQVAVISGSVDLVVEVLFPENLFDELFINRLSFDAGGRLVGGEPTPYDLEQKADGLHELARRSGLSAEQVVFIGDNRNDVDVAQAAGFSIAFNCKSQKLAEAANIVIEEHDLRAILPYLE